MKVTEHVEYLLKQGRDSRELVQLGFPKSVVTRVRKRLKEGKARQRMKVSADEARGNGRPIEPSAPLLQGKPGEEKLTVLESAIRKLGDQFEEMETRLDGTPALRLKERFKCSCGASGFVALHIKCTKCGEETWWGWFPKE